MLNESEKVQDFLKKLEGLEGQLLELSMSCLAADNGNCFPLDLLANASANRTMATSVGFRKMIEEKNFICAASLLRIQLDTALRFTHLFAWRSLMILP